MTRTDIDRVIAEIDRRWRSRTPARTIDDALPETRVVRSEMRLWAQQQNITIDVFDEDYQRAEAALFRRLRRAFPSERWMTSRGRR